ncbi:restriction endonuclease subunit S [Cyclobacterium xiamenense]|uniref:restriction endonuclease subunit S n=1 Tax=Cyclobacterium xiamenense TaxID=1297121 RepID=UPI0012B6D0B2|nr:restriction endonuclease subunit S [Cyclobacterium xiamenense]
MSKELKLIPELRFPEFNNAKNWEIDTLGGLTKVISKRNKENKNLPVYSINNKEGFLPQGEQFEGISSSKRNYDISLYKVIEKNTFAYNPARINIGSIGYSGNLHNIIISSLYVCFKTNDKVSDEFLLYFFDTSHFYNEVGNNVEGGIRSYLFYQNFSNITIPIPSIIEQQKIASCLSSLDELIAAHKDKLDALKDHKKGLLQNLFPQGGETAPKVRFAEFEGDGEWVENELGKIAENLDSNRIPITSNQREKGEIPYYGASGIIDYVKDYIFDEDLLLISEDGANLIARVYPIAFSISGKTWVNNHAHVLKFENWFTQVLVEMYLNSKNIEDFLTGMAQPKLNRKKLDIIPIPLPENQKEQQKIAYCLLAVGELITTQQEKIEQLEQHKKGLMQGLFPKIEN